MQLLNIITSKLYIFAIFNIGLPIIRIFGIEKRLTKKSYLRSHHWFLSLFAIHNFDRMLDLDTPWWTYRSISFIEEYILNRSKTVVFEYGSGASSLWLAKRCQYVTAVEHDTTWFKYIQEKTADYENIDIILQKPDNVKCKDKIYHSHKRGFHKYSFSQYAISIEKTKTKYDIIIIDGRARNACLKHAKSMLANDGIIVFDNANRRRYRKAIKQSGFEALEFKGLTPALPYAETTLILREENKTHNAAHSEINS